MHTDAQPQHEMRLEKVYATGAEEWFCPTCGRWFIATWQPTYKKIVLEAGDEQAIHTGGTGGLQMQRAQVSEAKAEESEPVLSDEMRSALEEILASIDLDSWPSTAD